MKLVQRKRKQQYIKAYCLMYPWYTYEAHCEWVEAVNSNSQLYKQAGNAVTVNVVEEIGRHIMGITNEENFKSK